MKKLIIADSLQKVKETNLPPTNLPKAPKKRKPSDIVDTRRLPPSLAKKMNKYLNLMDQMEIIKGEMELLGAKEEVLSYISDELEDNGTIVAKIGKKIAKLEFYAQSERVNWKNVSKALASRIEESTAAQEQLLKDMSQAYKGTVKEFVKVKQVRTSGLMKDTLGKAWGKLKGLWNKVKKSLSKAKNSNQNLLEALDEQVDLAKKSK